MHEIKVPLHWRQVRNGDGFESSPSLEEFIQMKLVRLSVLLLSCSGFCFAVNKDLLALQREMEDKIDALQKEVNSKLDTMNGMLTAIQADSRHNADLLSGMQESISSSVARSLTPGDRPHQSRRYVGEEVRSLKDSLADITARMERMDAKITDLKNQLQIMQSPPPVPIGQRHLPNDAALDHAPPRR